MQDTCKKKRVCVTGATGTMGIATLREFKNRTDRFEVVMLARPTSKNHKKLREFLQLPGFSVVWGDLTVAADVARAAGDADYVLHIGGMVSPKADYNPQRTLRVNVGAARNVVNAVLNGTKRDTAKVVYIGSIAQMGDLRPPHEWCRTGDDMNPSKFDAYALSKIEAELTVVDSGIKNWVALRQTGILCPEIVYKGTDPITFHVPLKGVLEWTTAEDSGRLMANLCEADVPDEVWNRFYNIGSGKLFRLTNYEMMQMMLKAMSCPRAEKVFNADWFVLGNFHGAWWYDSDELERLVPYRIGGTAEEYFRQMRDRLPWYFRLAPIAPPALIKAFMKIVAKKAPLGPLYWLSKPVPEKIKAYFGSREEWESIPGWKELSDELGEYPGVPIEKRDPNPAHISDHGYDENKPLAEIETSDLQAKADYRGGKLIGEITKGDLMTPVEWECSEGHRFKASANAVLLGGHWCPHCLRNNLGFSYETSGI